VTLPDPNGCHYCGHLDIAIKWGETICGMCGAPRQHAEPGCPVRNAMVDAQMRTIDEAHRRLGPNHKDGCTGERSYLSGIGYNRVRVCECGAEDHAPDPWSLRKLQEDAALVAEIFGPSIADETARERRVHGGGPRGVR
jgi:hypothetical protein